MIPKHSRGWNVGGLIRYLMGPGRANEHVEQRVIAAWDDYSVTHQPPQREGVGPRQCGFDVRELVERLRTPAQLGGVSMTRPEPNAAGKVPQGPVWQCSLRNHADDRILSDAEWAEVVADVLHRTGIAPRGDAGGCRWVAVRHADDHVHIAAVLVRQDTFKKFSPRGDWPATRQATTAAEVRLGLIRTEVPDRTAVGAPSRAEMEKAERRELAETPRASLRRAVRVAAVQAQDPAEFFRVLTGLGAVVSERVSNTGELVGYSVAALGDLNAEGDSVWFSGSTLAPDLSLPALRARWASASRTEPIPPASGEHAQVGAREHEVAIAEAVAAMGDATAVLASGNREEAAGIAHATEDMLTAVTMAARNPARDEAISPKDGPADVYQRAARTPGVGQPRQCGPVAARLRASAWRLMALRPLVYQKGGGAASTAALMVAVAELIAEIALYYQARQCLAQARAARVTREAVMARRPPGHPQQSRGPDGRRPGPTRTAGVSKEAPTARPTSEPPTPVIRPVIGQPGGNTPGRSHGHGR